MPELLISVRSADEARLVCEAGCRWVDVKEPRRGPLGRADEAIWHEIAAVVADRSSPPHLTIALGDAGDADIPDRIDIPDCVTAVKLSPAGLTADTPHDFQTQLAERRAQWERAAGRALPWAGVAYVDHNASELQKILSVSQQLGDRLFLFDTGDKTGPSAVDLGTPVPLTPATSTMQICFAGRLRRDQLSAVAATGADIIGVRSAVCRGDRGGAIDRSYVRDCLQHPAFTTLR